MSTGPKGKHLFEVLRKLADAAIAEPRTGKKLKTKKVKMLKAYSRRHANKTVVINNTVFAFDKDGNTTVAPNGFNQPDFDALLKIHGMTDCREVPKPQAELPKKLKKVAPDLAAKMAKAVEEAEISEKLQTAPEEPTIEHETADPDKQESRDESEPEKSEKLADVPSGAKKKKGRPKKRSEETKE